MGGKVWKQELVNLVYKYDFAELGGATGTLALGNLPDNFVVSEMYVYIDTTITSGGTPTLIIGEDGGGDADGYFADFFGTPSANTALKGGGALLSDGVHRVDPAKDGVLLTIGVAAVTAGVFRVIVRGFQA